MLAVKLIVTRRSAQTIICSRAVLFGDDLHRRENAKYCEILSAITMSPISMMATALKTMALACDTLPPRNVTVGCERAEGVCESATVIIDNQKNFDKPLTAVSQLGCRRKFCKQRYSLLNLTVNVSETVPT